MKYLDPVYSVKRVEGYEKNRRKVLGKSLDMNSSPKEGKRPSKNDQTKASKELCN